MTSLSECILDDLQKLEQRIAAIEEKISTHLTSQEDVEILRMELDTLLEEQQQFRKMLKSINENLQTP